MGLTALGEALLGSPLWLITLILLASMLAAAAAGLALRKSTASKDGSGSGYEGYIVSAVLGLESLLLGFTFALAVDRYDARRHLVVEEANAIGTAYLRTQLLEEPLRREISNLLMAYTDNRIAFAASGGEGEAEMFATNDELITKLWSATMRAFETIKTLDFSSAYLDSVNAVIDLDTSRKTARSAHVPSAVLFVLFIYVVVSAGVLGFVTKDRRGMMATAFLFALVALSLLLIIAVDRPDGGGLMVSQEPMRQARELMNVPFAAP